ncbi:MAG: hypothetical protein ABUL77_00770 [Bacteroidota bacterium]
MDSRAALLSAECRRDWDAVKVHLSRARAADPARGAADAALVALSLDHAYQAFETILVRLERGVGLPERTGSSWHAALLADAGMAIPDLRPALFAPECFAEWDALLRFRHFLRHAYVVDLDAGKLVANVGRLERAVAATDGWLDAVLKGLLGN